MKELRRVTVKMVKQRDWVDLGHFARTWRERGQELDEQLIKLFATELTLKEIAKVMKLPQCYIPWRVYELGLERKKRTSTAPGSTRPYSEKQAAMLGYLTQLGWGYSKIAEHPDVRSNANKVRSKTEELGLVRTKGHHCRKFTIEEEKRMRTLRELGVHPGVIAQAYGVTLQGALAMTDREQHTANRHAREKRKRILSTTD